MCIGNYSLFLEFIYSFEFIYVLKKKFKQPNFLSLQNSCANTVQKYEKFLTGNVIKTDRFSETEAAK